MRRVLVFLGLAIVIGILSWSIRYLPVGSSESDSTSTAPTSVAPVDQQTDAQSESTSSSAPANRVVELEQALALAVSRREEAQAALDALEPEVAALEAKIEEIEARGEDPADYPEIAMDEFRPSFFRYQDAAAALEEAEQVEQLIRQELSQLAGDAAP